MAEDKFNRKNPAVKRILQEVKEMQSNPSDDFMSLPLEENIFEWQFAICGPRDSEFEGGIYHGRIQLPAEYPLKPPSFMLLTPNGRFETQTKICLSISNYHPEHWQPSWSVRTALVALIAFMPTNPDGAIGSLDFKKEERRVLAIKSRQAGPKYGTPERQKLIDEIHQYMVTKAPPIRQSNTIQNTEIMATDADAVTFVEESPASDAAAGVLEDVREVQLNANAGPLRVSISAGVRIRRAPSLEQEERQQPHLQQEHHRTVTQRSQRSLDDRLYTWAAMALTVAILILLVKKYLKSTGFAGFQDGS